MDDIKVVAGWSAVEWEFEAGGRMWVEVHDACSTAYIDAGAASGFKVLSDIDGVCQSYADAYPLRCDHCGKGVSR